MNICKYPNFTNQSKYIELLITLQHKEYPQFSKEQLDLVINKVVKCSAHLIDKFDIKNAMSTMRYIRKIYRKKLVEQEIANLLEDYDSMGEVYDMCYGNEELLKGLLGKDFPPDESKENFLNYVSTLSCEISRNICHATKKHIKENCSFVERYAASPQSKARESSAVPLAKHETSLVSSDEDRRTKRERKENKLKRRHDQISQAGDGVPIELSPASTSARPKHRVRFADRVLVSKSREGTSNSKE